MDKGIALVARIHQFQRLAVFFCVRFGVLDHALYFFFLQAGTRLDGDLVFLAGRLVLGRNVQNAVGVYVESDFDLRKPTRRGRNVGQIKLTEALVA